MEKGRHYLIEYLLLIKDHKSFYKKLCTKFFDMKLLKIRKTIYSKIRQNDIAAPLIEAS